MCKSKYISSVVAFHFQLYCLLKYKLQQQKHEHIRVYMIMQNAYFCTAILYTHGVFSANRCNQAKVYQRIYL